MSPFRIGVTILAILALSLPAAAQLPGNNTLQGGYYFRYVGVNVSSTTDKAMGAVGTLTFDGNGGYQVTGQQINSNGSGTDTNVSLSSSGKYQVLSNGVFTMASPFAQNVTLFGGVGRGPMIVASSTDFPYCDLFVAIPASTTASNSTLSGTYYLGSIEFPAGNFAQTRNTFFPIAPDGRGGLGNVTISGTSINLKNAPTTQTSTGATYSVSANGTGTLTMPAPSGVPAANQLFAGTKNLYVSPDGNV
ncbi:MAG TPA: hypothetical protein VGF59_01680, partial [Bryobacteraceae bacterium]